MSYLSQELAIELQDLLHVTPTWRGQLARHDCICLRGHRANDIIFAKMYALFMLRIGDTWYHLGIVRKYRKKGRNKITGYIELWDAREGEYEIIFIDSIVRYAHILPATSTNKFLVVQDLYDPDMYLRLIDVK